MYKFKTCLNPWYFLCIEEDGNCFFCCSASSKDRYIIGNIFNDDIQEIWNGDKAQHFRKDVLGYKFTHCDIIQNCREQHERYQSEIKIKFNQEELIAPLPQVVQINYDCTCASRCVFCRDQYRALSVEEQEKYNSIIDEKLIPFFKNVRLVIINGIGELFDSKHMLQLVKRICQTSPDAKFEIISNGAKFSKENIENLGLENRIKIVRISVSAATEKTYKKIFRTDNFNKVMDNLNYISQLKKDKKVENVILNFVINSINYQDMIEFMKIVNKLDLNVSFSLTVNHQNTKYTSNNDYAVWDKSNIHYNKFVSIIKNPIFKSKNCNLDFDSSLKKISIIHSIKNYIFYIKKRLI